MSCQNEKLKKQNALYMLEQRRIEEERAVVEERVRKEKLKRENMKKTFKGVVGREKDKWEKQTVRPGALNILFVFISLN